MKSATALAKTDTLDPSRHAFAEAQQAKAKSDAGLEAARVAEGRARDALRESEQKAKAAAAAVTAAQERHADALTAAVSADKAPLSSDVIAKARQAEQVARDEVDAARAVFERLTAKLKEAESSAEWTDTKYFNARSQVVGIEVQKFIEATNTLQARLIRQKLILRELLKNGCISYELFDGTRLRMDAESCLNWRALPSHEIPDGPNWQQWSGKFAGRFYNFMTALDTDPAAQIESEGEDEA